MPLSRCSPRSTRVETWERRSVGRARVSTIGSSVAELDAALEAVADFVDVKSPYTIGHSKGVADLAAAAAPSYGIGAAETAELRRAGLVHDLGRLGVPNIDLGQGRAADAIRARARQDAPVPDRADARLIAGPRAPGGDGGPAPRAPGRHRGYPRGLTGADITPAGRLLAAADSYHARLEPRPHRPPQTREQAASELRADVRAGRIDGDAAEAVLAAAGHRTRKRREWPAGLTTREVDILRLLARGMSNKQIAGELVISPKTANTHVEHIYTKLGVTNRALASLFAAKHGLIAVGDGFSA